MFGCARAPARVFADQKGETLRLFLISDDNFSGKQQTVFLVFEIRNASDLSRFAEEGAKIVPLSGQSKLQTLLSSSNLKYYGLLLFLLSVVIAAIAVGIVCCVKRRRSRGAQYRKFVEMTRDEFRDKVGFDDFDDEDDF